MSLEPTKPSNAVSPHGQQSAVRVNHEVATSVATKKYKMKQKKICSTLVTPMQHCFKLTPHSSHFEQLALGGGEMDMESESITDFDEFNDEDFTELQYSGNTKRSGKICRSTNRNKLPKKHPNKLVSAHDIAKDFKKTKQLQENYSKQKSNVSTSLARKGMQMFGFVIYSKRAEPQANNKRDCPVYNCHHVKSDPPSVLQYELRNDAIPKDSSYLLSIVDLQHRELTPEDYELLLMLDMSVAPKTVQISCLQSIPTMSVSVMPELESQSCSICMEMYEESDTVKKLPCEHLFHTSCIDYWLSKSSQNCPLDGLTIINF